VSPDPSEIIRICWFGAHWCSETFLLFIDSWAAWYFLCFSWWEL